MGINSSLHKNKGKVLCVSIVRYEFQPPNNKQAVIGEFILPEYTNNEDWNKLLKNYKSGNPIESLLKDSKNCRLLTKFIREGVPVKWRWQAWKSYINLNVISYEEYVSVPADKNMIELVIKKDIDRTFPSHVYFDKEYFGLIGQFALLRVLGKFATAYSEIGYCQGMNFIAGFLLLVSGGEEIETFSMLESVIYHFDLVHFFTDQMLDLKKHLSDFDSLFSRSMKQLHWHFKMQEIVEDLWVLKWFITLFTAVLPLNLTLHAWDVMMVDGISVLPQVTLAILRYFEQELLMMDAGEILIFFSQLKDMKLDSKKVFAPLLPQRRKSKPDGKIFPFLHPRSGSSFIGNLEEILPEPSSPMKILSQCEITEDPNELPVLKMPAKQHSKISYKSSLIFEDNLDGSTRIESKGDDNFDAFVILNDLVTEDFE